MTNTTITTMTNTTITAAERVTAFEITIDNVTIDIHRTGHDGWAVTGEGAMDEYWGATAPDEATARKRAGILAVRLANIRRHEQALEDFRTLLRQELDQWRDADGDPTGDPF